jgi:hypothetical protein
MRRFAALGIVVIAAALGGSLAACSDGTSAPAGVGVADSVLVGTYQLQTINGQPLPFVALQTDSTSVMISSARLVLSDDHSWTQSVVFETVEGDRTIGSEGGDNGTWIRSGTTLSLFSTKNQKTAYLGSLKAGELDLASDGAAFVFTR